MVRADLTGRWPSIGSQHRRKLMDTKLRRREDSPMLILSSPKKSGKEDLSEALIEAVTEAVDPAEVEVVTEVATGQ